MPKIYILLACEECKWCVHIAGPRWHCFNHEKEIPDIGEIAYFCELDDWKEE